MNVMVRNPTDEMAIFRVPPVVLGLPADLRDDFCYWHLIAGVQQQRNVIPLGPMRDITYQYASHPDDIASVTLRHPCPECKTALAAAHDLLIADPVETLCVAQCVVDYLVDPSQLDNRFSPDRR